MTNWVDLQVYSFFYNGWNLEEDKKNLYEFLDRTEQMIKTLEEKRVRDNNTKITIALLIITFTGVFAAIQYFYGFFERRGVDQNMLSTGEVFAVSITLAAICAAWLYWSIRSR